MSITAAAFALEDHPRARELFQHGYDNAKVSGELWGRTAASAYTAYYQAMEGDYERRRSAWPMPSPASSG